MKGTTRGIEEARRLQVGDVVTIWAGSRYVRRLVDDVIVIDGKPLYRVDEFGYVAEWRLRKERHG